jgi:hypothetical protein
MAAVIAIGAAVWALSGSWVSGALTALGIFGMMPVLATALRVNYQKRHGLPVRGPWGSRYH